VDDSVVIIVDPTNNVSIPITNSNPVADIVTKKLVSHMTSTSDSTNDSEPNSTAPSLHDQTDNFPPTDGMISLNESNDKSPTAPTIHEPKDHVSSLDGKISFMESNDMTSTEVCTFQPSLDASFIFSSTSSNIMSNTKETNNGDDSLYLSQAPFSDQFNIHDFLQFMVTKFPKRTTPIPKSNSKINPFSSVLDTNFDERDFVRIIVNKEDKQQTSNYSGILLIQRRLECILGQLSTKVKFMIHKEQVKCIVDIYVKGEPSLTLSLSVTSINNTLQETTQLDFFQYNR